ncbi:MAG: hypothetical protein M3R72_01600 [Bacteroidota bacterium]|nr:hypothetical protein [Bacteroidota bacterium]
MDKNIEDKSSTENKHVTGQDPDRYEQGYGSFNENDFDKKNTNQGKTSGNTDTEDADKANIKEGMNEDKSTVSNTASPSGDEDKK